MKKFLLIVFIFLYIMIFAKTNISNYIFNVKLDTLTHTISGYEDIEYINNSTDTLYKINFHLYANLFNEGSDFYENKKSTIKEYGYTHIDSIFENSIINSQLEVNNTIAYLKLEKPLLPGDTVNLKVYFINKIPYPYLREGFINNQYDISQWYPKIAVYTKHKWADFQADRHAEFFGEYGNYTLNIEVPNNYFVFGSGKIIYPENQYEILDSLMQEDTIINIKSENKTKKIILQANHVHDMAFIIRNKFSFIKKTKDSLTVYIISSPKNYSIYKDNIDDVFDIFNFYSNKYIKYPYNDFTIADGILRAGGGMEYPQFIIIADMNFKDMKRLKFIDFKFFHTVVCHEIGHQWFYLIIGSNEAMEPFLDEGFTTYSENSYMEYKFGNKNNIVLFNKRLISNFDQNYYFYYMFQKAKNTMPINYSSYDIENSPEYQQFYSKGFLIIKAIEDMVGKDKFSEIIKEYFNQYSFSHLDIDDLFALINEMTDNKYYYELKNLLYENVYTDYYIKSVEYENNYPVITIANNALFDFQVPIKVVYEDNSEEVIKKNVDENRIKLYNNKKVKNIIIDPEMKYLDINYNNNKLHKDLKIHITEYAPSLFDNNLYFYPFINYSLINKTSIGLMTYLCGIPTFKSLYGGFIGNYDIKLFTFYNKRTNFPYMRFSLTTYQGFDRISQFDLNFDYNEEYFRFFPQIKVYNNIIDFNVKDISEVGLNYNYRYIYNNNSYLQNRLFTDNLSYIEFYYKRFKKIGNLSVAFKTNTQFSNEIIYSHINYEKLDLQGSVEYALNNINVGLLYKGGFVFDSLCNENAYYLSKSNITMFNNYTSNHFDFYYIDNGLGYYSNINTMFSSLHKFRFYLGHTVLVYHDLNIDNNLNMYYQTGLQFNIQHGLFVVDIPIYNDNYGLIWKDKFVLTIHSDLFKQF